MLFKKIKIVHFLLFLFSTTLFCPSYGGGQETLPEPTNYVKRFDLGFMEIFAVTHEQFLEHCRDHNFTPLAMRLNRPPEEKINTIKELPEEDYDTFFKLQTKIYDTDQPFMTARKWYFTREANSFRYKREVLPERPQLLLYEGEREYKHNPPSEINFDFINYDRFVGHVLKLWVRKYEATLPYPNNRLFIQYNAQSAEDLLSNKCLLQLIEKYPRAERALQNTIRYNALINLQRARLGDLRIPEDISNHIASFFRPILPEKPSEKQTKQHKAIMSSQTESNEVVKEALKRISELKRQKKYVRFALTPAKKEVFRSTVGNGITASLQRVKIPTANISQTKREAIQILFGKKRNNRNSSKLNPMNILRKDNFSKLEHMNVSKAVMPLNALKEI